MLFVIVFCAAAAWAQSSSIYKRTIRPPAPVPMQNGRQLVLRRSIAAQSFVAVKHPEPRRFALHDLITVIIRESVEADSKATLDTEKSVTFEGEISEFPKLNLRDLLNMELGPSTFPNGKPKLGVDFNSEFEGEGQRKRSDTFITRITARIVDIKPNGTLVVEGRKFIKSDKETVRLLITGTCRPQDITPGNTIFSTQLYDLNVTDEHTGELRKASKKGWLTKILEVIFNF